ncbi:hypothetical protein [Acidithiobacillus thiooxidans]|uniref:hypothetical protein n=1 Tax=Acidithiobacillus thiooxidans TaxID=930 RepID=UPI001C079C97|nr:hypothetical protein [Acidithiobacillus thiooxidans]MBU2843537.1 hypothetical protein [Acidithiobacillus thiooxidans]
MVKWGRWQVVMGGNGKLWQVDGKSPVDKTDTWHVVLWIKTERFCKWLIGNEYDLMVWMWLGVSRGGFMVIMWYGINGLPMLSTRAAVVGVVCGAVDAVVMVMTFRRILRKVRAVDARLTGQKSAVKTPKSHLTERQ